MAKIRIKSVPKNMMQMGGLGITPQDRDQWNRQQAAAFQQGYQGSNRNRAAGQQFMQSQGTDPGKLAAYQQDLVNQSRITPWGNQPAAKAGSAGFSGADAFYGNKTAGEQYTKYGFQHYDSKGNLVDSKDFGTDYGAATKYNNNFVANQNNGSQNSSNQFTDKPVDSGMGFQVHDWDSSGANSEQRALNGASQYSGFVHSSGAGTQSAPQPSGIAATGFPTREESIAKYKAKSAASEEPSADMSDYNMHSGKSEESKYGGKRKVRITGTPMTGIGTHGPAATPNATMMAAGGYASQGATRKYGDQQQGQGYALDRFWSSPAGYLGSTSQVNPYSVTGNTLPEAKDGGDINAEKQEMVLGDFDQDGQQELMNVNGKPHTEGGKDINVPSNSFVFSDTKALKIKDPAILAMFNMSPKKGGYTPAEIAKKYDLNKLKKILDDPKADEVAKKTTQLMNDNYLAKLNKLAAVQEGMKKHMGMDHHDPNAQQQQGQPPVQEAGNMGPGGENMMQPEVMAQYGGVPKFQYAGRTSVVFTDNDAANQEVAQSVPAPYTMNNNVDPNVDAGYYLRPNQQQSAVNSSIPGLTDLGYGITPYRGNKATTWPAEQIARRGEQYGWQHKEPLGEFYSKYYPEESQARLDIHGKPIEPTSEKNVLGNRIGVRYEFPPLNMQGVPSSDFKLPARNPQDIPLDTVPVPGMPPVVIPKDEKTDKTDKKKGKRWRAPQLNPNFMGDFNNLLQMAQLKKFVPYEPVPQAVIPQTVFADYTAQAAAAQEAARSAGEGDVGSTGRAMSLARQGESLKPVREAIATTQAQNVGIANAANAQAAQITNELMAKQANRLAELNKAGFLADRDYQRERGKLQAEYTDRMQKHHEDAVKTAWLNKTSPYFNIDPYTQMPVFKSPDAKAAYEKMYANAGQPDSSKLDYNSLVKQYTTVNHLPQSDAENMAKETISEGLKIPKIRTSGIDPLTGKKTTTSDVVTGKYGGYMQYGGTHMTMPEMAPRYQRNAERIPHYKIGGNTKKSKLKKFIK
jgi:hypothetical protein